MAAAGAGPLTPSAIEVDCADKVFDNGVRALEPISLAVREGEFATLIGPSGCGKSTLLRLIAGLVSPSSGAVRLWRDAPAKNEKRRRLDFVFQSPTLMAWSDVEKNVRLPLDLAGVEGREASERAESALTLVGLHDFCHAYPRQLSGGMQMRASIARALVTEPSLLLMDEPFGALDEITRARLDDELTALWTKQGLTILFVTHSVYEATFLSTRVLVMSARPGKIFAEVAIEEPHPRGETFRASQVFARYCGRLSELLVAASEASGGARDAA